MFIYANLAQKLVGLRKIGRDCYGGHASPPGAGLPNRHNSPIEGTQERWAVCGLLLPSPATRLPRRPTDTHADGVVVRTVFVPTLYSRGSIRSHRYCLPPHRHPHCFHCGRRLGRGGDLDSCPGVGHRGGPAFCTRLLNARSPRTPCERENTVLLPRLACGPCSACVAPLQACG